MTTLFSAQAGTAGHDTGADIVHFEQEASKWLQGNVSQYWRENRGALSEAEEVKIRGEWDRILYAGGYSGLSIPREYGGQGLGLAHEVAFASAAARAQAPDALGRIGRILTAPTLIEHGTQEQKDKYLNPILSGEHVWCQGFSEPASGSDLANVKTLATKVDGGYLVRGRKTWTSYSAYSHRCLLLVRTDVDAPRYKNLSVFLADMKSPGISLSPIKQISGSQHFSETDFDDVFIPDSDLLGGEGNGWGVAMTILKNERGTVEGAVRYIEIRADMDLLVNCCAKDGEYKELIQNLDTRAELVKWQVSKSVAREGDQARFFAATAGLKVIWSDLWKEIANLGIKISCSTHRAHWRHQYLESRSASIYSGTNEIQRNIVAERVLGLPK